MKIQHRSYGGKFFRPKPLIHEEDNFAVIVTCWGSGEHAPRVVEEIVRYISAAAEDVEMTSPFEHIAGLSEEANYLRIACFLANDLVIRGENRLEYNSGYEVLSLVRSGDQLAWAQVGSPQILYKRPHSTTIPLAAQGDLNLEAFAKKSIAPLPARLLGLERTCQVNCGDIRVAEKDQLVLLSSDSLPRSLWLDPPQEALSLEKVTNWMAEENPESAFWMGLLQL